MVPRSLIILVGVLVIGFASSFIGTMRRKSKEDGYQKVPPANGPHDGSNFMMTPAGVSYQNQQPDHYALPNKQKEVTYCVIDGRLVDS